MCQFPWFLALEQLEDVPLMWRHWSRIRHFLHAKMLIAFPLETVADFTKEHNRSLNSWTKILMWLAIHKAEIGLVRCVWNYKHSPLRKISELNGPRANTASHGFPTGIHCALLHSPIMSYVWASGVCILRAGSHLNNIIKWREKKTTKTNDRFMSGGKTHATCFSFPLMHDCFSAAIHMFMNVSWGATKKKGKAEDTKA